VLKQLVEIFKNYTRAGDISSRYGGEEFVIMFHHMSLNEAKKCAEAIRIAVSKIHVQYGAQHIGPITISIGIAVYPTDGTQIEELMEHADRALYLAKKSGRNRVIAYSETSKE
jgi:diguanylate cyclase (GGDEF)-like protein